MEEKKKRWRPSLTAYRAQEREIADLKEQLRLQEKAEGYTIGEIEELKGYKKKFEEQLDGSSRLVKDCDLWREKYQELVKKYDSLQEKNNLLEKSNGFLSKETDRLRELVNDLGVKEHNEAKEIERLRKRGFWARVFNK